MYFIYLLISSSWLFIACFGNKNNAASQPPSLQDTIVIAKSNGVFSLSGDTAVANMILELQSQQPVPNGKYLIRFGAAKLSETPDGVYELYFSKDSFITKKSSPQSPAFAGVLDTYTLAGNPSHQLLFLDVSEKVKSTFNKPAGNFFMTVLFRGNLLTNGSEAKHAGKISIADVSLIRTK